VDAVAAEAFLTIWVGIGSRHSQREVWGNVGRIKSVGSGALAIGFYVSLDLRLLLFALSSPAFFRI
jgi:hypothetical protein